MGGDHLWEANGTIGQAVSALAFALVIDLVFGTHPELASALAGAIEAYPRSWARLPSQSFTQRSSIRSDPTRRRISFAESRTVSETQERGLLD